MQYLYIAVAIIYGSKPSLRWQTLTWQNSPWWWRREHCSTCNFCPPSGHYSISSVTEWR